MRSKTDVLEAARDIREKILYDGVNPEAVLGYTISNSMDCYPGVGESVLEIIENNPEEAVILEKMLIQICGMNLSTLLAELESDAREYSELLC